MLLSIKTKSKMYDIYYYVIGLFILFGLPPTMMVMDTAMATIVAGGQAPFKNIQILIELN